MTVVGTFQRLRRSVAAVVAVALLAPAAIMMLAATPASAEIFPPRYVRSIGGAGRPGVFSWGVQHNPVTNEILVADYLHFKVRRYDMNGNHLGDFWRPDALGQPYSIGVDPNDGAIYVAELKDNPLDTGIAKYDKTGAFLYASEASLSSVPIRRTVSDAVLTLGSTTMTSATAAFSSSFDVGAKVTGTGIPAGTIINSRTSSTSVVLSQAATEDNAAATVTIDPFPTGFKRIPGATTTAGSTSITTTATFSSGDVGLRIIGPGIPDGTTIVSRTTNAAVLSQAATATASGLELRVIPNSPSHRAFYTVWLTVEEDTGDVFVLDSHYQNLAGERPRVLHLRFDDALKNVTTENAWNVVPPGVPENPDDCTNPLGCDARLYGIDIVTAPGSPHDDVIYMSDAWNSQAYRYTKDGTHLTTFGAAQTGGDNRGVAVDEARNVVYLVDAQFSQVDRFNMDGAYLGSFGSEGSNPGQFTGGGRQVDVDSSGNVWVADFGGFETEKYSPYNPSNPGNSNVSIDQAPVPARKPPAGLMGQPRDAAVDDATGEVWVADAWNQRFSRYSATGTHMGTWGARGPGGPFDMNYPRHIAIQPANTAAMPGPDHGKRIWIGQERGHHLQVYNYPTTPTGQPAYVTQIGQIGADDTDPNHFRWPVDIEFYTRADGTEVAVIGDRMASSVKIFNANTYQEITRLEPEDPADPASPMVEVPMIEVSNHGTAIDPATGNIFVVRPSTDRIEVYDQAGVAVNNYLNGTTPVNYFGSAGTGNGQMRDAVDATIHNGIIYVSDEGLSRVTAFDISNGAFLGRWGSTFGSNIYDFRGAIGLDTRQCSCPENGYLYVTDTGNDRVQVFNPNLSRQFETTAPGNPVVQTPASAQANLTTLGPVSFTGTATDNVAVGQVEASIQDFTTGKWWNANNQSWEDTKTAAITAWSGTAANSVNWRWTFLGVSAQGRYVAEFKTRDHNGNVSGIVMRTFAMPGATAPPVPPPPVQDTTRPNGTQATPTASQVVPLADVTFTGAATDNVGVTSVRIAIKRVSDGRWLSSQTSTSTNAFSTAFTWFETTLDTPGATSANWSWIWSGERAGDFQTLVEARDAAGNVDSSKPQVNFTVSTFAPDTTAPETVLTEPVEGATSEGAVAMSGSATDNQQVASVALAIQNTANGLYWTGSGWSATGSVNATLAAPNTASTGWTYSFDPGIAGSFTVMATARDVSNNVDASPAGPVGFSITASVPDTVRPTVTITAPTASQVLPNAPFTFTGAANDNVGVQTVQFSLRNRTSLQYWNGSTQAWQNAFFWNTATLASPGSPSTSWSYDWTPPAGGAPYNITVRALDTAAPANISAAPQPFRNFSVS